MKINALVRGCKTRSAALRAGLRRQEKNLREPLFAALKGRSSTGHLPPHHAKRASHPSLPKPGKPGALVPGTPALLHPAETDNFLEC
jgi:hypothetical protein